MAPPSKVILRTIRELSLNNANGVLIIVPANTGDLLNFGLAAERALNDNISVKLLAVSDNFDKRLPKVCRSGLSGVILVYKIAGSLSVKEKSLNDIFYFCEQVVKNIISFEIISLDFEKSKSSTNIWITEQNTKKVTDIRRDICQKIVDDIYSENIESEQDEEKFCIKPQEKIIVLLNNCGGFGKTEEYIFLKELLNILQPLEITVVRFYCGNFMKCTQKMKLSVTILKVFNQDVLTSLDEPCSVAGWKNVYQYSFLTLESPFSGNLKRKDRLTPPVRGPKLPDRVANVLLLSTQFACDALISCERQLNIVDSEICDGDAGTRLKNTAKVLLKRIRDDKLITNYPFTFFESLSKILEATVGGTAGCIYSILFEAAGNCFGGFCENDEVTPFMWLKALEVATRALKRYGNIEFGDGTMYDPIFICAATVREELEAGQNYIDAFGKGVIAAEEIAQKTKKFKQKYPDSGAHAVGIWMRAAYEGVKLRCPIE
ncbi:triokinase/FMN cyclase-like isoform X2 [Anoplophora glabripennis]|nr:triokinase/FMN cyclase-like isoform X2 [Anoplophora glabripennis]